MTNIIPFPICKFWNSQTYSYKNWLRQSILIPIRLKKTIHWSLVAAVGACNLRNLHMFLHILEFTVENKLNCFGKTFWKMWSKILEKNAKKHTKIKTQNHEIDHNLCRTLGTKLVLLVDY